MRDLCAQDIHEWAMQQQVICMNYAVTGQLGRCRQRTARRYSEDTCQAKWVDTVSQRITGHNTVKGLYAAKGQHKPNL